MVCPSSLLTIPLSNTPNIMLRVHVVLPLIISYPVTTYSHSPIFFCWGLRRVCPNETTNYRSCNISYMRNGCMTEAVTSWGESGKSWYQAARPLSSRSWQSPYFRLADCQLLNKGLVQDAKMSFQAHVVLHDGSRRVWMVNCDGQSRWTFHGIQPCQE